MLLTFVFANSYFTSKTGHLWLPTLTVHQVAINFTRIPRPGNSYSRVIVLSHFSMNMLQASNVKDTAVELNFIFEDSYEFEIERNLER